MLRHIVMKAVFVLLSLTHSEVMTADESALHAEPSYAKWGKMAMEETSKTYLNASIIDYKYVGRTKLSEEQAEESFVLWLRKDAREFGVRVSITIQTSTDQVLSLTMKELDSK
ncbi:DUF3889 domain-containing protein [Paenibacillus sp. PL91]|uniref:DUF3889 domain-containing protein n=1 Tax=Paenibacillus sp. PL91 TaxID=2729538 RepID=UPI00145C8D86|nr:DUF3889 domain-containing protein [Paenibacillus sp. PL91]MBC9199467.1 DUF3889 domain-containing protein [Paenibacillus sp. PL91]